MNITIGNRTYTVKYIDQPYEMIGTLQYDNPTFFTYDTETTGLHIKKDRPFWGAVCWGSKVYVFPTSKTMLHGVLSMTQFVERIYCHHTTFDMHMTANIVGDEAVLAVKNWGDTMGLARLSFEAISTRDGGDSLALKTIGKKYIDPMADKYEKTVKHWLKQRESEQNKLLTALLKPFKWSYTRLKDAQKASETLPENVNVIVEAWKKDNPRPTYQDVPQEIMLPYLAVDVILTQQLVEKALPVVFRKQQEHIIEQEFKLIPVVFKMERVGFELDRGYLLKSKVRLEQEIEKVKERAFELAGREFKSGQHKVIKEMYEAITEEQIASVDKRFLKGIAKQGDELAPVIIRWRTLEKWLETYIVRLLDASEYDGRLYTTLGQFNPVSGRFSGDFQQMPKQPLYNDDGDRLIKEGHKPDKTYEIFHPRRAVIVSPEFDNFYYLDFSQVELRVQAHYTLPFGGDLNLCRAYCPYECLHYKTGEIYSLQDKAVRDRWDEKQDVSSTEQLSAWIIPETREPWKPTDVHAATTIKALVLMGIDPDSLSKADFKFWRGIGKQYNFAKNYGVGPLTASQQLGITYEEAEAMGKGYTEAFPKVIDYQNAVIAAMWDKGYVKNLSGRRYYIKNSNRFYKCANYLIQGSCADDLKKKMLQIDEFLTRNHCKSRMVMCVHDEIIFESINGEEWVIKKIKSIMENTPEVFIPIVAESEVTKTSWADKQAVEL